VGVESVGSGARGGKSRTPELTVWPLPQFCPVFPAGVRRLHSSVAARKTGRGGGAASGDSSECRSNAGLGGTGGYWEAGSGAESLPDCFSPPRQGLAANPSGYGPLTELPDWSYADGRPAPPMKGQLRRKAQREKFARRVVLLSQEMDAGLQAWQLKQQEKLQEEEGKQKNALKPKGALLQNPRPKHKSLDTRKNRL
uniref:Large ribosomal subunit protein mL52 n=1 Tax=Ursus maritimus TaxID=29073 RepID=A0A452UDW9_URSMA